MISSTCPYPIGRLDIQKRGAMGRKIQASDEGSGSSSCFVRSLQTLGFSGKEEPAHIPSTTENLNTLFRILVKFLTS